MLYAIAIGMIVAGYLFGSIPAGYLLGRAWGVDLLHSGSGRTGGTNVLRAAGLLPAALTILSDALKGLLPTYIAVLMFPTLPWVPALTGAAAVTGHNYSIFLKFRGGAGGVTALGALAGLSFWAALTAAGIAIVAIVISRYASVATFSGSVTGLVMLVVFALLKITPPGYILYGVIVVGLIAWGLRPNFARLRAGTERKIGTPEKNIKTLG
ncbi:MAG: glycerol-3-phosphate acyltransferase [Caldilineae bacterium]|nr:MAG: glycerol-3-phosphate acyltransferase [Caldilineae bacterium]